MRHTEDARINALGVREATEAVAERRMGEAQESVPGKSTEAVGTLCPQDPISCRCAVPEIWLMGDGRERENTRALALAR